MSLPSLQAILEMPPSPVSSSSPLDGPNSSGALGSRSTSPDLDTSSTSGLNFGQSPDDDPSNLEEGSQRSRQLQRKRRAEEDIGQFVDHVAMQKRLKPDDKKQLQQFSKVK